MNAVNNIINDGILCGGEGFRCYNRDKHLIIEYHDGSMSQVEHDAYFINTVKNKVYFASKNDGFNLYEYDVNTKLCNLVIDRDIRWLQIWNDALIYTSGDNNFLYQYHLPTRIETILLSSSCNYLCLLSDRIYFSNWSSNKELWQYSLHSHDVHKVLDIDACWINTDGENIIFRAWHNRKTYLYNIGKCKLRVLNADGSNYLHYSNGYIYYDNIRLGGLWRQSVDDKSDKICISPAKVKRINTHGNTLIFQDEKKQTVMMEIDRISPLPILPYIEMVTTTCCNRLCPNCSNGIPLIAEPSHVNFQDFKFQLDALLSRVSYISKFQIHGGEPLLNPNLPRIISYIKQKQKIKKIRIATNGTIVPSDELVKALQNSNIILAMSSYHDNKDTLKEIIKLCKYSQIKYKVYPEQKWFSFTSEPTFNADDKFQGCPLNKYLCYHNWHLYLCARICHCYSLYYDSCSIDIRNHQDNLVTSLTMDELHKPCEICTIGEQLLRAGD